MVLQRKTLVLQLTLDSIHGALLLRRVRQRLLANGTLAWFSCYAPYEQPKFALALCLEEGGSGGTTGSPIAARIMDAAIRCSEGYV